MVYPLACHVKGPLSFQHYNSCRSLQKGINLSYLHLIKYWVLFYLYISIYENWSQMITLFKQYDSFELCEFDNGKFLTFGKSVFFHTSQVLWMLFFFFCQISLRFRLKTLHWNSSCIICLPSLSASLVEVWYFLGLIRATATPRLSPFLFKCIYESRNWT